jgi:GT2 family glycosyltransferase
MTGNVLPPPPPQALKTKHKAALQTPMTYFTVHPDHVFDLTISIVTFNTDLSILSHCLVSVQRALKDIESSVVYVVDNSNIDYTTELKKTIESGNLGAKVIAGHGNIGYGAANNLAIRQCESRFHLILNPDTVLNDVALTNALKHMNAHKKTVLIGAIGFDAQGNFQYLNRRMPTPLVLVLRGFAPNFVKQAFAKRLRDYEMRDVDWKAGAVAVEMVSGAFMFCRSGALKAVGGFDEKYFLYFEDYALSRSIGKHGELVQLPNVQITHLGGNTARKGWRHVWMFSRSALRFFAVR